MRLPAEPPGLKMLPMKTVQVIKIAVLLSVSALFFGQTNPPSEKKTEHPDTSEQKQTESDIFGPVEVLSDTNGVDFKPYLQQAMRTVREHWYQIIPPVAQPPVSKQGKVAIEFAILRNGSVSGMKLVTTSNDTALDRAAWGAITSSNPFQPLPSQFGGPYVALRFQFYYNPNPKQPSQSGIKVSILPVGDVHLTAGSSHVFFAKVAGTKNSSVTWTVTGSGCSGAACGTMMDGLYVAPDKLPSPPIVIVTATSQADSSASASLEVPLSAPPR